MREAMFYEKSANASVQCHLCPHMCVIPMGGCGLCRARINQNGVLNAANYCRSVSFCSDPIEKKPLYHFHPGSAILSMGPNSCNLKCDFCQNYQISQFEYESFHVNESDILNYFSRNPDQHRQIAITYTEPITWIESILDLSNKLPDVDIVLVTNGYVNTEPLEAMLPAVKAMNIDLKSMRDEFYNKLCGGSVHPVKRTIERVYHASKHVELTYLLIPGENDADNEIEQLAQFIASINCNIPLHISGYHPSFNMSIPATQTQAIEHACKLAKKYLYYVYAGNVASSEYRDTCCPHCDNVLIMRHGWRVTKYAELLEDNRCPHCRSQIYGVFS